MKPLPTPDCGTIILLAYLTGLRDIKGVKWCRARGVGGARRRLGTSDLTGIELITAGRETASLHNAVEDAARLLAMQCRLCGQCDLATRDVPVRDAPTEDKA
jgi:hypothetical protein